MKTSKSILMLAVVSLFGFGTIGCGSGFEMGSKNSSSGVMETELELEKLDAELEDFDEALLEVDSELNRLSFNLILSEAGSGSSSVTVSEIETQSLKRAIDRVFDRVIGSLEKVNDRVEEIRARLELYRQMLDPDNELHIPNLDRINEYIQYLEDLRARIEAEIDRVIGIMDSRLADIDRRVMEMDVRNPLSWVVAILWQDVRSNIMKYRGRLIERIRG